MCVSIYTLRIKVVKDDASKATDTYIPLYVISLEDVISIANHWIDTEILTPLYRLPATQIIARVEKIGTVRLRKVKGQSVTLKR